MRTRALGLCVALSACALLAREAHGAPVVPAAPAPPTAASVAAAAPANEAALGGPSSDSFSNEETSEAEQQHRIDLYGFADMLLIRGRLGLRLIGT